MTARWRTWGFVLAAALLCLSALVGVVGGRSQATAQLDRALVSSSAEHSTILAEYFDRARTIDLLLAQSPTFAAGWSDSAGHDAVHVDRYGRHQHRAAEEALAYLEEVYPGQIGEACLIDVTGVEHARVVAGAAAPAADLSVDEASAPFFAPTVALPPGRVYQAKPYLSPDTGTWVISNSTMVPGHEDSRPAMVHFEAELDGFVPPGWRRDDGVNILIVDRRSGQVLVDFAGGGVVADGEDLGRPGGSLVGLATRRGEPSGIVRTDRGAAAFEAVPHRGDNANDWVVVAVSTRTVPLWASDVAKAALAVTFLAFLVLVLSVFGLRRQQQELRSAAETDSLTGLLNRRSFTRHLEAVLAEPAHTRAAVLLVDLNGFKEVNDTLGHHAGDVLLADVARRLQASMRAGDVVARLGGDEFAVVLPLRADGFHVVLDAVQRILEGIRSPFVLDGVGLRSDASVGVALFPEHGSSGEELLQRADVAMYRAKEARVGHALYSTDSDPHSPRRLQLISGLHQAIEARELFVQYQPKVRLETGQVEGVEALVRWEHPELGLLPPGEFIPLAETMGLIRPLTMSVLDQVLEQICRWGADGLTMHVAVNCSATDLGTPAFADEVAELLERHRVPAHLLRLEITETMLLGDPERAVGVLARLHAMGVTLSMDDFGTGYSSMGYLRQLPLTEIKVDRSFVSRMVADSADSLIVRTTIDLGHSFGLVVVAEGVEDEATMQALRDLDCDVVQGYHLARPMSADDVRAWVRASAGDGAALGR